MIDGSFALVPGIGRARERELIRLGILCWADFPEAGPVLSPALDARLRGGLAAARALLAASEFITLLRALPVREHWRLFPHLEAEAGYLDIETTAEGRVTVIGVYDPLRGPRLFVRGHNLGAFVDEPLPQVLLTFNGGSFDLPVLRRTFPRWIPPPLHLDLRTVFGQLGERGGLKAIEERCGIGRPAQLKGVGGADAIHLWEAFRRSRDQSALRRLLEYNLYDVVQLRSLAELACERLSTRCGRPWAPRARFLRGDVLLDMSRVVEAIVARSSGIVADAIDDEERVALRG